MDMTVQGTMPRNSSMLVQHWTEVTEQFGGCLPGVDDRAELGHLEQGGFGRVADGDVLFDGRELGLRCVVGVLHAGDAAHDFAEVEGFDGDAAALQQFFRVADGVECGGTRADGADAEVLQAANDAADGGEPGEVGGELGRVGGLGVQRGERVGDAVLGEVVADGHLAAEAVAAMGDGHLGGRVGRGLDEDGDAQIGETDGVGQAALLAEVGQGDDEAVDGGGVGLEEGGTLFGVLVGLDRAVGGDFRREHDGLDAGGFERGDDFEAARCGEVRGEESAVAYENSHGHLLGHIAPWYLGRSGKGLTPIVTDGTDKDERRIKEKNE